MQQRQLGKGTNLVFYSPKSYLEVSIHTQPKFPPIRDYESYPKPSEFKK